MNKLDWFCIISGLILATVCGFHLAYYNFKVLPLMGFFGVVMGFADVLVGISDLLRKGF